jgi:hypothetical protein
MIAGGGDQVILRPVAHLADARNLGGDNKNGSP